MQHTSFPLTHDLVMIGGGHTHALVLRQWGMKRLVGARVTLIHPGPTAPYSGMLPGFVAGHYDRDDLDIDLIKLARFAGARVISGSACGIDLKRQEVQIKDRHPVGFDLLSVNLGVTAKMPSLPGFDQHGVPAKPLGQFATKWAAFLKSDAPGDVAVIGGGVAGCELAMAMAHTLRTSGHPDGKVTVLDKGHILSLLGAKAATRIRLAMARLGIDVIERADVQSVHATHLTLNDGRNISAHFITGTAGAQPIAWLGETGLDLVDGFIKVDAQLRSSDVRVFAAGDCVHLTHAPRPKAGVYAVREAPVLYHNLRASLIGDPLRAYKPQKDYLKLISLGGQSALAEKFGTVFSCALMWRWKNRIDQTFMRQFRTLPEMPNPKIPAMHTQGLPDALGDKPLCGGCGAKVGRAVLRDMLKHLPTSTRKDIRPLPGDDAALLLTGNATQVISTDHLRAFCEDPAMMTRIAAIHALGDIWAMGAQAQAATATIILPQMVPALLNRTLQEIMTVANEVMSDAGAQIVGGHTSLGNELTIGFTITGLCDQPPITLARGKAGDALILTKPLGLGVLLAAEMAGCARGEWVLSAYELMRQSQADAAKILARAHAMTDVTGFGLAGHLLGLCEASDLAATLDLAAIPTLRGAEELAAQGVQSTLFRDNRAAVTSLPDTNKAALLFDPQTAGGLLAAVPSNAAPGLIASLTDKGYQAAVIGQLHEGKPDIRLG